MILKTVLSSTDRKPVQCMSHTAQKMQELWQVSDDSGSAVEQDELRLSYPEFQQTYNIPGTSDDSHSGVE